MKKKNGKTLLASDYDGTLTRLGFMFPSTRKAIRKYRDDSHLLCVDSGRSVHMFNRRKRKLYDYIIGSSGSRICDQNRNMLYQQPMDPEDAWYVYDLAREVKARFIIVHLENTYYFAKPRFAAYTLALFYRLFHPEMSKFRLKGDETVYQISIDLNDDEKVREVVRRCQGRNVSTHINGKAVDVCHSGCNKVAGLKILQEKIRADKVYTIGDELNDYEMLREFESFMMAHGNSRLSEVSNYKVRNLKEAIDIIRKNEENEKPA